MISLSDPNVKLGALVLGVLAIVSFIVALYSLIVYRERFAKLPQENTPYQIDKRL